MGVLAVVGRLVVWGGRIARRLWHTRPALVIFLFYVLLGAALFRDVLFQAGTIGLRNDWSLPPFPIQYQARFAQAFTNWSHDYLGYVLIRRTDVLLTYVLAFFATVFGFGGAVFSKAIPLLVFPAYGFFSYMLLRTVVQSRLSAFLGSLIYMLSPLAFNAVVFGQHHLMVGYALFPLLLFFFLKAVTRPRAVLWVIATGVTYALAATQDTLLSVGGLSMVAIALAVVFGRERHGRWKRIQRCSVAFLSVILIAVLLHAHMFFPIFQQLRVTNESIQFITFAWNTWYGPSILDAFTLDGAGIRSFYDAITMNLRSYWVLVNTLVILVILSALTLPTRRTLTLYLAACALGLLFLFKGLHPPLSAVNRWLFENVPGMLVFRNLQYLTIFINLIFAFFLAFVVEHWLGKYRSAKTPHTRRLLATAFTIFLTLFALRLSPYATGISRNIQTYHLGKEHEELFSRLYRDPEDYRVLWLPPSQPMTYKATKHAGLDPFGSQSPKPSLIDNPTQPIEYFLHLLLYTQPKTNLTELLRALAVRYVIYRGDFVSRTPNFQWGEFPKDEWTNEQLRRFLGAQEVLQSAQKHGGGAIEVYRHARARPRLDARDGIEVSTGDLSNFVWLADYWPATGLVPRDTLYPSQIVGTLSPRVLEKIASRVNIANNNLLDLSLLFLDRPAVELRFPRLVRDARDGWSPQWWWKDWRYAAILDPAVFTISSREETIPFTTSEDMANASLWVKSYKNAKGSALYFSLDGQEFRSIRTQEDVLQGLEWNQLFVGTIPAGKHQLKVANEPGESAIARLLIIPDADLEAAQGRAEALLSSRELLLTMNLDFRDSPTHTPVASKRTRSTTLFVNADVPLMIPVAGTYDIAINATGGSYVSQQQQEGDSYQTIERGKTVGQIFTLEVPDTVIERVHVSAEARELATNTPASVMPDAPLVARLYRMDGSGKTFIAESAILPSSAGINDAWKLVDADFNIPVERRGEARPVYAIEYSTDATNIVWAVRTVNDGFRGRADHYAGGQMFVKDSTMLGDLAFSVVARSDDAKLDALAIDATLLPSEDFSLPWRQSTAMELSEGIHTISLRGVRSHTAHVQLALKRRGPAFALPPPPSLAYTRHLDTHFSTDKIRTGAPYVLSFLESFNPGWQVLIETADGHSRVVPEDHHFKIQGYANAWLIDEQRPHTVVVRYAPQRSYTVGLYTNATTFVGLVGIASWYAWRMRRRTGRERHPAPSSS